MYKLGYQKFRNGFEVTTNSAIDKRLYLTKAEMLTAHTNFNLPDVYINICPTDSKLYVYKATNTVDPVLGKFRPIETNLDLINDVRLELESDNDGETIVNGNLVYTKADGTKQTIASLKDLRDYILTPGTDTPDVEDTGDIDSELTIVVTDTDGNAVKMTLEQLRQRFLASTAHDNKTIDDAQIGEFVYDEIIESEIEADWIDLDSQATWEAQYADPNSTLNKYYKWSDDVNKPYKEDLWNTVENRAANITDARKVDGEYVYDENGNCIYDNCERCWLGAINAPGASYPWAVVELPIPFEGTIRFNYKDGAPVYPWGEADRTFTRGFAIASIPDELNMPELKINAEGVAEVPLNFGDLVVTLLPKLEEEE